MRVTKILRVRPSHKILEHGCKSKLCKFRYRVVNNGSKQGNGEGEERGEAGQ